MRAESTQCKRTLVFFLLLIANQDFYDIIKNQRSKTRTSDRMINFGSRVQYRYMDAARVYI